jgi:hypothetical protein
MTIPQWLCVIYLVIALAFGSYVLGCYRRPGPLLDPVNDLLLSAVAGLSWPIVLALTIFGWIMR